MDAVVSARFYRATPMIERLADFPDLLLEQMNFDLVQRERDVTGTGVNLRVEHCEPEGEFVIGQFCRKQITNIPPQAGPDGLKLGEGQGLGHLAAFRYHRPTRILLLQTNIQSASPNRVSVYVQKLTNGAGTYVFKPVLREDALERFKNRTLRSFTVGFASPENLEALDEKGLASAKGARLLAEAFNGLEFTITVSAGRGKKKYLNFDTVWNEVTSLLGSGADIKKLEVMANPDDEGNDIDFLEEHLKCRAELELSDGDPEANYQVRRSFLASEFAVRLPYVMKHFGAPQ